MLVPGSVDILDTCHASLPPYKCWEGAALLLKHFPVRVHHLHVMGLPSDCSASAAVGNIFDIDADLMLISIYKLFTHCISFDITRVGNFLATQL